MTENTMKRSGKRARLLAGLCLAGALAATSASAEVKLRVSTPAPPGDFLSKSIDVFKEALDKSAPGEFAVSGHPGGTLFKQGTEIPAMQRGNLEMNTLQSFEVAQFAPELSVFNAGYLFDNYDHAKRVWDGPIGDAYRQTVLEKMGIHILADCYLGTREVAINQVRNVKTPEDMKGIKLRMPGSPDFLMLGKGLGVDPTPMAMSEVYLGMKAGTVDGQDNPLTITKAAKLDEVTKEVVMTNHAVQTVFYAIAEPVFAKLSAENQGKVTAAARAACAWNDEMRLADEAKEVQDFAAEGIVISHPDLDAFRANMKKVYEDEGKYQTWPEDVLNGIAALR